MSKEVCIAETEWKVMEVLWQKPNQTITEIKAALSEIGWSDSTVKTLVRRLTQKGALAIDRTASPFCYYPLVEEEACRRKETRRFIDKIYNGSVKMLIASLTTDSSLTDEESQKLMEIIDKMEGDVS